MPTFLRAPFALLFVMIVAACASRSPSGTPAEPAQPSEVAEQPAPPQAPSQSPPLEPVAGKRAGSEESPREHAVPQGETWTTELDFLPAESNASMGILPSGRLLVIENGRGGDRLASYSIVDSLTGNIQTKETLGPDYTSLSAVRSRGGATYLAGHVGHPNGRAFVRALGPNGKTILWEKQFSTEFQFNSVLVDVAEGGDAVLVALEDRWNKKDGGAIPDQLVMRRLAADSGKEKWVNSIETTFAEARTFEWVPGGDSLVLLADRKMTSGTLIKFSTDTGARLSHCSINFWPRDVTLRPNNSVLIVGMNRRVNQPVIQSMRPDCSVDWQKVVPGKGIISGVVRAKGDSAWLLGWDSVGPSSGGSIFNTAREHNWRLLGGALHQLPIDRPSDLLFGKGHGVFVTGVSKEGRRGVISRARVEEPGRLVLSRVSQETRAQACSAPPLVCRERVPLEAEALTCGNPEKRDLSRMKCLTKLKSLLLYRPKSLDGLDSLSSLEALGLLQLEQLSDQELLRVGKLNLEKLDVARRASIDTRVLAPLSLRELELTGIEKIDFSAIKMGRMEVIELDEVPIKSIRQLGFGPRLKEMRLEKVPLDDLRGLEKFKNLISLSVFYVSLSSVAGLEHLKVLESLRIHEAPVKSLKALFPARSLKDLSLDGSQVLELRGLEASHQLEYLDISNTPIRSLDPISKATSLKTVRAIGSALEDVGGLRRATRLIKLDLAGTQVRDITPLQSLVLLVDLDLSRTPVNSIAALKNLTKLQELNLRGTQVSDLQPLSGCVDLHSLFLSGAPVSDISALASLKHLRNLWLDDTQVTDLRPLYKLERLEGVSLRQTSVSEAQVKALLKHRPGVRIAR